MAFPLTLILLGVYFLPVYNRDNVKTQAGVPASTRL